MEQAAESGEDAVDTVPTAQAQVVETAITAGHAAKEIKDEVAIAMEVDKAKDVDVTDAVGEAANISEPSPAEAAPSVPVNQVDNDATEKLKENVLGTAHVGFVGTHDRIEGEHIDVDVIPGFWTAS